MNNSSGIRLVLADVDGTLVTPDKTITDRARAAVRKLAKANIAFAITSGRPPRGLSMLVEPLELRTPIAGFNGGSYVRPDLTPIEMKAIPQESVAPIIRALINRGLDVWIYQNNDWFLRDPKAPYVEREQRNVRFAPIVTDDLERHVEGVIKIVGVSGDHDKVAACEEVAREHFGDRISAMRSQRHYIDVTHPDANKGEVARRLAKYLDIPREAIATLGDMPNDLLMFANSGLSIAMGQSSDEVKGAATRVTRANTEEGFAEAIERFILNER